MIEVKDSVFPGWLAATKAVPNEETDENQQ